MKKLSLIMVLLFLGVGPLRASNLHVSGDLISDEAYDLHIIPSDFATDAIVIHLEPSNQVLAVVIDSEYSSTEEGKGLLRYINAVEPSVVIETDLPMGQAQVTIAPPDFRNSQSVKVTVFGENSVGKFGHLIARAMVRSLEHFSFESGVNFNNDGTILSFRHCCTCGTCGEMCVTCDTAYFSCDII